VPDVGMTVQTMNLLGIDIESPDQLQFELLEGDSVTEPSPHSAHRDVGPNHPSARGDRASVLVATSLRMGAHCGGQCHSSVPAVSTIQTSNSRNS
jgi:hypothetical protein